MVNIYSPCLSINKDGHLAISGCDTITLAEQYGTPLYVMSEDEVRHVCKSYVDSFGKYYHGKLEFAIDSNVSDIVVDNFAELELLGKLAREKGKTVRVSLRIKPGIDAHTHEFIRTGQVDSKFGLDLASGEALQAVTRAIELDGVKLIGLHCHIGSQIMEKEPFVHAAEVMLELHYRIYKEFGVKLEQLNLGGGFGIHYLETDDFIPYHEYMEAVSAKIGEKCVEYGINQPKIYIEPGRSIVGEAGITLYTVGNIKEIPNVRSYVSINGGMFDNPRYVLYQSDYTCLIANKAAQPADYVATIAGKCCESGDLIQEHTHIQKPETGDILAVLSTGAYNYSMASNYNRNPRPACVMVKEGESRIIIKGETYEDLVRNDL